MESSKWLFPVLISCLSVCWSEKQKCGPDMRCHCWIHENQTYMDCSSTYIQLKDICKHIGTYHVFETSISSLDASSNRIASSVNASILEGCESLQCLNLGKNGIIYIEKGSFDSFPQLKCLNLSHNFLDIYHSDFLLAVIIPTSLDFLMLNNNLINTRSAAYPVLLNASIKDVYMDGLPNIEFPDSYKSLEFLSLSGFNGKCNLSEITNDTLKSLENVITLDLSSCNISAISAGAFVYLKKLETLNLSYNRRIGFRTLRNISYGLQFTNIRVLNYSSVHRTFGIGTELLKRDICYLWNTSLTKLSLDSNRVEVIETNALMLFPKTLKRLHMADNKFTFGPYLFQLACADGVEEFHGAYQNNAHKPFHFVNEKYDIEVSMEDKSDDCPFLNDSFLQNLSKTIGNCPFYESDTLFGLTSYPAFPHNVQKLIFHDAGMKYEVPNIMVLPLNNNITSMTFAGNIFTSLIGPVGPLPNAKRLDFSQTICSYIHPDFFHDMYNLQNLQLYHNLLGALIADSNESTNCFRHLSNLKVLNLSANQITYIPPQTFVNMTSLENLDLSYNSIAEWTINVDHMNNLTIINLRENFIGTLPSSLTSHLVEVSNKRGVPFSVDLGNNTLKYECKNKEFLKWILKYKDNLIEYNFYNFVDDNGKKLSIKQFESSVKTLDKYCKSYALVIVLSSSGISIFLFVVIGAFVYKNRWKIRYLLYTAKFKWFGYVRLPDRDTVENYRYDAFISYAEDNAQFVLDQLAPKLEEHERLSLCLHQRDFTPGKPISDNILDAIKTSKKTVVIITDDFLKQKWCMYEFHMARMESIYSRAKTNCLLVVMLENVSQSKMPLEMVKWISEESYIEYTIDEIGNDLFWTRLCDAICH